jgi:lysophospholipase L1-like esterase
LAATSSSPGARILSKALAIALGLTIVGGGAWLLNRAKAKRELTVYEQKSLAMRELIARHAREAPAPPPESRRYYLSADVAPILFPFGATEEYDAWSYFRHKSNQRLHLPLAEHAGGSFECSTNSLGLREDGDLSAAHPDLRILVTGDSHTDGVCENSESYANRLEASLLADRPGKTVEVLNAGTGGFSFYNYLGVLEKFLDLAPDAFIVGVYGGNDFREVLFPLAYFERTAVEEDTPTERIELERGRVLEPRAMNQAFRSILSLRAHPAQGERAVRAGVDLMREMQAICREHAIHLLCLYIPSPTESDWKAHADVFEKFRKEFSLSDQDLHAESRVADTFLEGLRSAGIEALDAREVLVPDAGPYYWNIEFHLNVRGHEKIAEALRARIATWKDFPPPR